MKNFIACVAVISAILLSSAVETKTSGQLRDSDTVVTDVSDLDNNVTTLISYLGGEDARVTVTNYYGSTDRPHLYLEQKISDGGTNYWKVIWDEVTRLNPILARLDTLESDRAWGFYDSHTGSLSPDGYTSVSSGGIILSNGLSYQKTLEIGRGDIWILSCNEPTIIQGVESNGFLRISDGDGTSLFEVVKGDKRTVGANAYSFSVNQDKLTIVYKVKSNNHPVVEVCHDLQIADWKTESECDFADFIWSGQSENWICTITFIQSSPPKLFIKASYERGGNTYIKQNVAHSADKVVIGGKEYSVTVETVNGKKLMVLKDI